MGQSAGKKQNTASVCEELAVPVAERLGVTLWEVAFEKEGATWYLRYYIDSEDGVDMDTCEQFSREMSDILDAKDPIDQSYVLEVGSPGLERQLSRDWHFDAYIGEQVCVRLIRPVDGVREFSGTLAAYDRQSKAVTLTLEGEGDRTFAAGEIAYVRAQLIL